MSIEYSKGRTTVSAKARLGIAIMCGLIAFGVTVMLGSLYLAPLVAWDVAALVYVLWVWLTVWPLNRKLTGDFALREDPSRTTANFIVLCASIVSLLAVGVVLIRASKSNGAAEILQVAFGVLSVVLSWVVVHTLFTLRYAELYYTKPEGGVDFKEGNQPSYKDFAYLAFTIGMTFQVSDTDLKNQKFRTMALKHALISYMFGTVIVATTINLVAGLSK